MTYKVLDYFTDLQDKNYAYNEGDTYPRKGLNPSEARIHELASDENVRGVPIIVEVEDSVEEVESKAETETVVEEKADTPKKGRGTSKR